MHTLNKYTLSIIAVIFSLAAFRLLQIIPNVSPIAAMALFSGAYFTDKKLAFVVPFAALLLSDLFLGLHSTMIFVYGAFALTVVMGNWLGSSAKFSMVIISAFSASILFFLITNFGVWMMYDTYPATAAGLLQCYVAGLPFYQYTLIGDLSFVAILFGGYALLQNRLKVAL